ncbi:MAG: amidase [Polyangiales bacterium]
MAGMAEYSSYDALGLAELVRKGEVTPAELVDEAARRIDRVNGQLNAVVHRMDVRAREQAGGELPDGPLRGVPILMKDLLQMIAGEPTSDGCRFLQGHTVDYDTELVARYRRAGLVFVAKTNTPEHGLVPVTEPELFGPAHNPWDLERTTGGSSGGSAAAVAAGIVPAAHGGDGGGSIRIPASCCGLFGLKPTRGRNPLGPDNSELWNGFVQEHVITRSVRDSAALLDATHGPEPTSPYWAPPPGRPFLEETRREPGRMRIAFHTEPPMPSTVDADCAAAVHDAAELCEELGHDVEEVQPGHDPSALGRAFFTIVAANTAADLVDDGRKMARTPTRDQYETATWLTAMIGRRMSAADLAEAQRTLEAEARRLVRVFGDYDAVLTPTLGKPPVKIGELQPKGLEAKAQELVAAARLSIAFELPGVLELTVNRVFDFDAFPPVANFTGQPSMNVPLYWNGDGLPLGVMFTARFGDEAALFRLAAQLEQARPWKDRRPPVHSDR